MKGTIKGLVAAIISLGMVFALMPGIFAGVPAAPTTVQATVTSSTTVQLTWSQVSDATSGYNILVADTSGGTYNLLHSYINQTDTSHVDTVATGTVRWYKVVAKNADGDSPESIAVGVWVGSSSPSGLTVSSGSGNVTLSWNSVSGANSYNIYRGGSFLANTASTNYTDPGAAGGNYSYQVSAVKNGVEGPRTGSSGSDEALSVSQGSLDFGVIRPGNTTSSVLTVEGRGLSSPITWNITGADSSYFYVGGRNWSSSTGGTIHVGFRPTANRDYSATLVLTSGSEQVTVSLSGTGSSSGGLGIGGSSERTWHYSSDDGEAPNASNTNYGDRDPVKLGGTYSGVYSGNAVRYTFSEPVTALGFKSGKIRRQGSTNAYDPIPSDAIGVTVTTNGDCVLTLKRSWLSDLSTGEYELRFDFMNHYGEASLTVNRVQASAISAPSAPKSSGIIVDSSTLNALPQTGDATRKEPIQP